MPRSSGRDGFSARRWARGNPGLFCIERGSHGAMRCRIDAPLRRGTGPVRFRFLQDGGPKLRPYGTTGDGTMKNFAKIAAMAALALGAATVSAQAAFDRDASTETVLGAGAGALVGRLASHSA